MVSTKVWEHLLDLSLVLLLPEKLLSRLHVREVNREQIPLPRIQVLIQRERVLSLTHWHWGTFVLLGALE